MSMGSLGSVSPTGNRRQVPADAPGDPRRGILDRIPSEMRISGGRLDLGVTE